MLVKDKVCPKNNFLLWDYDHSNFGPIFRLPWVIFSLSIYLMFVLHIQDKLSDPAFWWTDYWSKIFGKASSTFGECNGKRDAILPEKNLRCSTNLLIESYLFLNSLMLLEYKHIWVEAECLLIGVYVLSDQKNAPLHMLDT